MQHLRELNLILHTHSIVRNLTELINSSTFHSTIKIITLKHAQTFAQHMTGYEFKCVSPVSWCSLGQIMDFEIN